MHELFSRYLYHMWLRDRWDFQSQNHDPPHMYSNAKFNLKASFVLFNFVLLNFALEYMWGRSSNSSLFIEYCYHRALILVPGKQLSLWSWSNVQIPNSLHPGPPSPWLNIEEFTFDIYHLTSWSNISLFF